MPEDVHLAIARILDIATEDEHLLVQYQWQVGNQEAARAALIELLRLGEIEVYAKASEPGQEVTFDRDAALSALMDLANWEDPSEHPHAALVYAVATDLGEARYYRRD